MTIFNISQSLDFSFKNDDLWSSTDITSISGDLLTGVEQIHLYHREKGFSKVFWHWLCSCSRSARSKQMKAQICPHTQNFRGTLSESAKLFLNNTTKPQQNFFLNQVFPKMYWKEHFLLYYFDNAQKYSHVQLREKIPLTENYYIWILYFIL